MGIKYNKLLKKVSLLTFLFFIFSINLYATKVETKSEKYLLYNISDNEVILEKNADEKAHIASLTKIMTVITAIENIKDFDEKIIITEEMLKDIEWDVAVAGFDVGDKVTYNDLLYASILASGADAVNALAISISGSFENFVNLMNKKVKKLNLKNTNFANVTGLFDENNYSSARDMVSILKYAIKNEKFKEIFETHEYTTTNNIKMKSTITRSTSDIGVITGAKTGYIKAAGLCLATTAQVNDANLILVTLNAYRDSSGTSPHITDTKNIYNYIEENYSYQNIIEEVDVVSKEKVKYTKEKEIDIHANKTISKFLPNNFVKDKIKIEFNPNQELSYFTKKGTNIGTVKITYNNEELSNFDLLYKETVSFSLISLLFSNIHFILLAILILYTIYKIKHKKKKRRRKVHRA